MPPLICFTDGSAIFNGKPNCRASFAVVWPSHPQLNCAEEISLPASNNRGEFSGAIKALQIAELHFPDDDLHIYTDSKLLIQSMTSWIYKWVKNNWMKANGSAVLNKDLLDTLHNLVQKRTNLPKFIYVKAHTKDTTFEAEYNRLADKLAKDAIK